MYFDLTKKEYKEYDKKFRKTYVGKKLFIVYVISLVMFCITTFGVLSLDFFTSTKDILRHVVPTCFLAVVFLIMVVYYEKLYYYELKDYINTRKK